MVGLILINYKDYAKRFLADARDSLRSQTYPADQYRVYVVDNATTPETEAYLRELYPEATILPTVGNGWGHANNVGMRQAFSGGCTAVGLINMDTIFDPNWLQEAIEVLKFDSEIGVVQSTVILHPAKDGKWFVNSLGNQLHFLGFGFCNGYGVSAEDREAQDMTIRDISYASGASLFIKKEVIDRVGMCDEAYFMYHDDLELSWKARLAGFRVVLAPKSVVYHKYEFNRSVRQIYYMERNRYITLCTLFKIPTFILIFPALLCMEIGMIAYAIQGGWFGTKMKVDGYFFTKKAWKHICAARAHIQTLRRITEKESIPYIGGRILFQEINNPLLQYIVNPFLALYWRIVKKCIFW